MLLLLSHASMTSNETSFSISTSIVVESDNFSLVDGCNEVDHQLSPLTDTSWAKASLVIAHSATVLILGMHVRGVHASVEIEHPVFALIFQVGKNSTYYSMLHQALCLC